MQQSNPEVWPRDIREFIIFIFTYTFDTPLHFTPLHFLCRSQTVLKEPYFGGISYPSTSIYIHSKGHTYKIPLMVLLLSSALGLPV
jgi:hypothetical protein